MKRLKYLLAGLLILAGLNGYSQEFDKWKEKMEGWKIEPYVMFQLWSSYSVDQQNFDEEADLYLPVDDRFSTSFRRARLGFRMQPFEGLKFKVTGAYDLLGRDLNAALIGGANTGARPNFSIWDAYLQWRIKPDSEAFYLVGGYFRPQISRESITSAWNVASMEKAMSQTYIRGHLTGTGPGHAPGLNLGGLLDLTEDFGLNYNFGIFNPANLLNGATKLSPLYTGRVVAYFGDPEMTSYKIGYTTNYFGQRHGLSVGLGGAWQGETDRFLSSYTGSVDFLFNWGPFNADGEWNFMWREGERSFNGNGSKPFVYDSGTGHLRLSYNLVVGDFFLEPSFMTYQFLGATDLQGQADADAVNAFSGQDYTYDVGINWHLAQRQLKLALHYTWHEGDAGEAGDGFTGNLYYWQPGVGAIRRGDWLGLGLSAIF